MHVVTMATMVDGEKGGLVTSKLVGSLCRPLRLIQSQIQGRLNYSELGHQYQGHVLEYIFLHCTKVKA
jgi:hypothetical protein